MVYTSLQIADEVSQYNQDFIQKYLRDSVDSTNEEVISQEG